MGTPEFAEVALQALAAHDQYELVGVVTRQDTPKNRGHVMMAPPVKTAALSLGLPVYQPANLKEENFRETLCACAPDIIVVAAYGKILPKYVLEYPKYGCLNIHASLLPKYRGAAPIQRAIMDGESEIGVTIMEMAEGLDTGDMLTKSAFVSDGTESYGEIHDKLAMLGASLIVETIERYANGEIVPQAQEDSLASYAAKIEKTDRILHFSATTEEILNRIRAFSPTPGAEATLPSGKVKITAANAVSAPPTGESGTIATLSAKGNGTLTVNTANGQIAILRLIPEGKKEMSAGDFIRGRRITETDRFL